MLEVGRVEGTMYKCEGNKIWLKEKQIWVGALDTPDTHSEM